MQWHDGKPFTSADVVFNWEYAADPATAAVTIGSYKDVKVSAIDATTVRVEYPKAAPFWADPFVGTRGMIIPKHLFEAYKGAKSRDAPNNLKPVGTGPYKFVDFTPGDMVRGTINTNYHQPNRPYFDTIEMKGGGDAVSAARAVLQTGEFDYAWNLQVEDEILLRARAGRQGPRPRHSRRRHRIHPVQLHRPLDRSRRRAREHQDQASAVHRPGRARGDQPAGRSQLGAAVHLRPHRRWRPPISSTIRQHFRSQNNKFEFNVDKANQVLETAGWKKGADGIRAKDGKKLKFVYQTSVNQPRQKTQAIVKQACQKAGIDVELKTGHRVGVLFLRCRQSGRLHQVLLRHADVHDDDDATGSRNCS